MTPPTQSGTALHSYWTDAPVCVFGGNGFLGRHIVAKLLERGARVRTLSLPGPAVGDPHPNLDARTGDLADPDAMRAAVEGTRVVFLAAGPVGAGGKVARAMGTHTDALTRVLNVLPSDARLVLTSSIVTVGAGGGEVRSEDSPFPNAGMRVAYVQAKRAAEEAAFANGQRNIVVVNPGYLFGPDDPGLSVMGELCVRFWRGNLAVPPPGGINAVDVRDVAEGHLLAAERGVAGRRAHSGRRERAVRGELFAALARAGGLRRALLPSFRPAAPAWVYWALAAFGELGHRFTGKEPRPSFEFVRLFRRCWFVKSARAETELGYRARPLAETLADVFAWHAARTRVAPRGLNRLWLRSALRGAEQERLVRETQPVLDVGEPGGRQL